ncbi:hypothetical protein ACFZAR_42285 [Streptomyces sp. NPDC008222]|uniref:hypothetical protein n=1 Tax=Streptomyces sp. NPDC008222 TaxID=3364820 RepID=UPI0036EA816C
MLKHYDEAAREEEDDYSQNDDFCAVAHFHARVPCRKFMAVRAAACTWGLLRDLQFNQWVECRALGLSTVA